MVWKRRIRLFCHRSKACSGHWYASRIGPSCVCAHQQGHLGSTSGGLAFLEDEEIIDVIVEIAEQSPVLTMKG